MSHDDPFYKTNPRESNQILFNLLKPFLIRVKILKDKKGNIKYIYHYQKGIGYDIENKLYKLGNKGIIKLEEKTAHNNKHIYFKVNDHITTGTHHPILTNDDNSIMISCGDLKGIDINDIHNICQEEFNVRKCKDKYTDPSCSYVKRKLRGRDYELVEYFPSSPSVFRRAPTISPAGVPAPAPAPAPVPAPGVAVPKVPPGFESLLPISKFFLPDDFPPLKKSGFGIRSKRSRSRKKSRRKSRRKSKKRSKKVSFTYNSKSSY